MERRGLGKGLDALIAPETIKEGDTVMRLNPAGINPNRYQPRINFDEEKLQELIESVRTKGVVQPILVRRNNAGEYELIAGERRLRAAKELGMNEVPAMVKNATDRESLELSLIENIQRDDLNPLEEAQAYDMLMRDFGFTQEQVAQTVGKDRATIANMLRLLTLPQKIKDALSRNMITLGHAKVILSLSEESQQLLLLEAIRAKGLSVRQAEEFTTHRPRRGKTKKSEGKDGHIRDLETELQHLLGTKVTITHGKKRGTVHIEYYSLNDLERILSRLRRQA